MRKRPTLCLVMAEFLTRDLLSSEHRERLSRACEVLDPEPLARFDETRAAGLLQRSEILLTGWGCPPLDAGVLGRAPRLRAVVHAAGTVKGHVTEACFDRGLVVSSAAAANALPVAEYTLAAILFASKRLFRIQRRYREERAWRAWAHEFPDLGNLGKTVGIVGASRIGRRVMELLRHFEHLVLVYDPHLDAEDARELAAQPAELDDLLRGSDVVSLHAPSLPETRHMLDARRLGLLRDGAVLVNTARGALIEPAALERELVSGRIDAVLDVTDPEVLPADSPLYEVERLARGEPLAHAVGRDDLSRIA
jgi:phosphoglycerate dehydrogenase-like enzyme